jgi:hypothetical protein
MARIIEYHNEFGLMNSITNGVLRVYQDITEDKYTWLNIWVDGKLVGSIDIKLGKLLFNLLPKDNKLSSQDKAAPATDISLTTVDPIEPKSTAEVLVTDNVPF